MTQEVQPPFHQRHRRKALVAWLVGAGVVMSTAAFAALTVTVTQDATSGSDTIARCSATATVSLGTSTYDATDARYEYADVSYSGISACSGDTIKISATNASNVVLGTASGTVPVSGAATLTWSSNPSVPDTTTIVTSIQAP